MISEATFDYVVKLRREIHEYPEIGFDLPRTLAVVRRELDALGIPYTEKFGRSSIVGYINPHCKGFTIGLRADMDALPMQEETDVPFRSKIDGQMHACGHDAHTAMLLGAAKELKAIEGELKCRVALLFTPAEEYIEPGCKEMAENGVMDDINCAVACHVAPHVASGKVTNLAGPKNANSMGFTVEFFGKTAHAAGQQVGKDAIAMAVQAYTAMHTMLAKEFPPTSPRLLNIGSIEGGHANNVICDYCKMYGSARTYTDADSEKLINRIRQISEGVAAMQGGEAKTTVHKLLPFVINDPVVTQRVDAAAAKVVGRENVLTAGRGLGGEDFGFLSRKKPCCWFTLGTGCSPETRVPLHNVKFSIDESAMRIGVEIFLQFVLDNMEGIQFEEK